MSRAAMVARCDLAVRLVVTNGLPRSWVTAAVGIGFARIVAIADGGSASLDDEEDERLAIVCAILVRLEIRLGHDPAAARRWLATPLGDLNDETPAAIMANGLDGLRTVHRLAGEVVRPDERWWRCAPRR